MLRVPLRPRLRAVRAETKNRSMSGGRLRSSGAHEYRHVSPCPVSSSSNRPRNPSALPSLGRGSSCAASAAAIGDRAAMFRSIAVRGSLTGRWCTIAKIMGRHRGPSRAPVLLPRRSERRNCFLCEELVRPGRCHGKKGAPRQALERLSIADSRRHAGDRGE